MRQTNIWIGLGLAVVLIGVLVFYHRSPEESVPQTTTVVTPEEPITQESQEPKAPLPTPKTYTKDGMNIQITKEGTGTAITNGQTAVVSYVGKFEDGTVFDASKNHGDGSFAFALGAGQVIKGWDEGVLGMKVGESRTLTIPPELAYGPNGIPGAIPPNATLIFDVTLLGIK